VFLVEEIDEEIHDGSDLSNKQSQDFSNKKPKFDYKDDLSDRGEAFSRYLAESRETNQKIIETAESQKLRKSKQSESLKNQKIYNDTNNFDIKNNQKQKPNENSNSDRYLSEEISNSEDDLNKNNNLNSKNSRKKKLNSSPQFYSKANRKSLYKQGSDKKDKFANEDNEINNYDSLEKEKIVKNEKNSNRSRNQYNRGSNPNDIESHLSSDRNTYYTFNEKYNQKKVNLKNKPNILNSMEFDRNNDINKKSIQRYEEYEEENIGISEEEKIKNKEKSNNYNKNNAKKIKDGFESKNFKSKNSRSKAGSDFEANSPLVIRKSIKYAAYGESFDVSESEKISKKEENILNYNYSEDDSLNENRGF